MLLNSCLEAIYLIKREAEDGVVDLRMFLSVKNSFGLRMRMLPDGNHPDYITGVSGRPRDN